MVYRIYVFPKLQKVDKTGKPYLLNGKPCFIKDIENVKVAVSNTLPSGLNKYLVRSEWCWQSEDGFMKVCPNDKKMIHWGTNIIDANCKAEDLLLDPAVKESEDYAAFKAWQLTKTKRDKALEKARQVKRLEKEQADREAALLEKSEEE